MFFLRRCRQYLEALKSLISLGMRPLTLVILLGYDSSFSTISLSSLSMSEQFSSKERGYFLLLSLFNSVQILFYFEIAFFFTARCPPRLPAGSSSEIQITSMSLKDASSFGCGYLLARADCSWGAVRSFSKKGLVHQFGSQWLKLEPQQLFCCWMQQGLGLGSLNSDGICRGGGGRKLGKGGKRSKGGRFHGINGGGKQGKLPSGRPK